jgi:acyl-CoA hydrolase
MMSMVEYKEMYANKKQTPEDIAQQIISGDVCACPVALSEPRALIKAIAQRAKNGELERVQHHTTFPQYQSPLYDDTETDGRFDGVLWFVGAPARQAVNEGRADIMPCYFGDVPTLWREYVHLDVFYATVSPMDKHGYFSFGLSAAEAMSQFESASRRFLEVNPNMPRTFGSALIHISQVDALYENTEEILTLEESKGSESKDIVSSSIGNFVAEAIPTEATLQLGWGNVPNAVGMALKGKRHLGIHSELFTDSMLALIECGAVDNSRKNIDRYKSVATFAMGSRRLYDYIDDNPAVSMRCVDYVNDPAVIAQNDRMVSVNAGLEVDFFGQVAAETLSGRPYSSTGGQVDFVRGAQMSRNGISFITMPSTAAGGTISRITPRLGEGTIVTTSKNDVDCVVTEFGIARLKGRSLSQRAKSLIDIAHPKFRDELIYKAKKQNIIV